MASSRFGIAMVTALNVILLIIVYILASRELAHRERMRVRLDPSPGMG